MQAADPCKMLVPCTEQTIQQHTTDNCHCKTKHSLSLHFASPKEPHQIDPEAYTVSTFHEDVKIGKKAGQKEQEVGKISYIR
jgi:hypothetical protein